MELYRHPSVTGGAGVPDAVNLFITSRSIEWIIISPKASYPIPERLEADVPQTSSKGNGTKDIPVARLAEKDLIGTFELPAGSDSITSHSAAVLTWLMHLSLNAMAIGCL